MSTRQPSGGPLFRTAIVAMLVGCSPYRSGEAFVTAEGSRAFRCLELHVAPYREERSPDWVAIEYRVGNTCRQAARLDLGAARVETLQEDRSRLLRPHDPREELHAAQLDGRSRAREVIAYEFPVGLDGNVVPICVDLGGVADFDQPPPPYCFSWIR